MKFILLDRIEEIEPGKRLRAVKALTLAEEYLADHFPAFPVMPGVLMLESMIQAGAWLVHVTEDFAHSVVLLKEAKNVTYKSFVAPGQTLRVEVDLLEMGDGISRFSGVGVCGDREMVKARFTLAYKNLSDDDPSLTELDQRIIANNRRRFGLLAGQMSGCSLPGSVA